MLTYADVQVRATIYNIFRIPLNFIVVVVLANLKSLHDDLVFTLCACFLALAAVLQVLKKKICKQKKLFTLCACFLAPSAVLQVHTQRCTLCACLYEYPAHTSAYVSIRQHTSAHTS